ncbi:MAG: sulfatase-like hydrolase/transferase, partial [Armatimonadota bacterium]
EVAHCDRHFRRVLDALKERGLYDDTVIILVSDHGDVMGDRPPWWGHLGAICDSLIHVPLIVRHPGTFEPGTRVSGITQTQDIFATACEIAGAQVPELATQQSRSLINAARGEGVREFGLSEHFKPVQFFERILRVNPDFDVRRYNRTLKAWRSTDMKYVWASDGRDELYDLTEDPGEKENIARTDTETVAQMREGLEDFLKTLPHNDFGDLQSAWPGKAARPEIAETLQAWGLYRKVLDWPDWAPR